MSRAITVMVGALIGVAIVTSAASAETVHRHHPRTAQDDRPLTIGGQHRPRGIYRVGNDIIAPGGFSAHGYGYPVASPDDRREAYNASIRARASGPYGYGADGIGGLGFEDDPETGYDNPYYGNSFNRYVGYDGLPTQLAFGPGFANRHITGHDPIDDDPTPPPTPAELGFVAVPGDE